MVQTEMGGCMMQMPSAMYKKGGKALKPVDKEKNPGLAKLPTKVRNKITYADKIAGATGRTKAMGGGLMEATARLKRQGLKNGSIARGCRAIMSNKRKKTRMV